MNTQAISFFESLIGERDSSIARDLKLNIKRILEGEFLSADETNLGLLALGASIGDDEIVNFATEQLASSFTPEQILEAKESAAITSMLNVYYKFRRFLTDNLPAEESEPYKMAKLRMNGMAKPHLGKDKFELLALGVSALNGCEPCVVAHEKTCREHGVSPDKIHEMARLAAVVKAIVTLK
jgi:alkyl hydroperoxide reductase subunit D